MPKQSKDSITVSVDPGIELGYAIWDHDAKFFFPRSAHVPVAEPPRLFGCIHPSYKPLPADGSQGWAMRGQSTIDALYRLLDPFNVRLLAVEYPAYMGDSTVGEAAARKGDLIKLAWMTGAIASLSRELRCPFRLVPVHEWKGQMSKELTERRVRKRLARWPDVLSQIEDHAWDAVGIGLHVQGACLFTRKEP